MSANDNGSNKSPVQGVSQTGQTCKVSVSETGQHRCAIIAGILLKTVQESRHFQAGMRTTVARQKQTTNEKEDNNERGTYRVHATRARHDLNVASSNRASFTTATILSYRRLTTNHRLFGVVRHGNNIKRRSVLSGYWR